MEVARLVLRQDPGSETDTTPVCTGSNDYDGRMGVRISSIFVILVGSTWGKLLLFVVHHVPILYIHMFVFIRLAVCNFTREGRTTSLYHAMYHVLTHQRRYIPNLCETREDQAGTCMDILRGQVLWFRRYHCNSVHPFARPCK